MTAQRQPNPDPLRPDDDTMFWRGVAYAEREARGPLLGLVLAGFSGAIMGALIVLLVVGVAHAAPRSAQTAIPAADLAPTSMVESGSRSAASAAASGNLSGPIGAPLATPPLLLSAARGADLRAGGAPLITEPAAMSGGLATWCAPTPKYCHGWGGKAHLGAVPSFRYGDPPYRVVVHHGDRSTVVLVVSFCACPGARIIDLSPAAFSELAPMSLGVIPVTLEELGSGPTPPPTDTEP